MLSKMIKQFVFIGLTDHCVKLKRANLLCVRLHRWVWSLTCQKDQILSIKTKVHKACPKYWELCIPWYKSCLLTLTAVVKEPLQTACSDRKPQSEALVNNSTHATDVLSNCINTGTTLKRMQLDMANNTDNDQQFNIYTELTDHARGHVCLHRTIGQK